MVNRAVRCDLSHHSTDVSIASVRCYGSNTKLQCIASGGLGVTRKRAIRCIEPEKP